MTKLYIAYGSNINTAQMQRRCPAARPVRSIIIDDARLVFRGVADLEFCAGSTVPVVLWSITEACERSLDRFEGVAQGVYEKRTIPLDNGEEALVYVMCSAGIAPPTSEYYARIAAGYAEHGLDLGPLEVALKHSHVRTQHSPETRRRHARNITSGNVLVARKPMHVPLSAVTSNEPSAPIEARGENEREVCHHGRFATRCVLCEEEADRDAQQLLPLPKPDPRYDGYNWSERAKAGSRKNKKGKNGNAKNQVVYEDRVFETPAHRAAHIQNAVRNRPRNKQIKVNKNLSDWLKDKGYT